jgi:diacylglycerol kinase family enzyme
LRAQWDLKQLLVVSRCFVDGSSSQSSGGGSSNAPAEAGNNNNLKKKKKKKRRKKASAVAVAAAATPAEAAPLTYFLKYEDEIFQQNASLSFFFDASRVGASKSPAHDTAFGRESYLVALIDVDKLPACIESMEKMLEGLQEK